MALASGTTLGPYQIQAPLGAGGMGEVYQASDTQLDRTVAIKVLPEHVANDPDLKQRFEGKSQASLIGAIMTSDPPPISALEPLSPAPLDRVVKKCLAKDRDDRWHSAHDLHDEPQWGRGHSLTGG